MNPQYEPQIEQYLDQLCAQLTKLPAEKQTEVRRETRAHLVSMVTASEMLEITPADALAAALKQFGDPVQIGRQIANECRRDSVHEKQAKWLFRLCVAPVMLWAFGGLLAFIFGKVDPHLAKSDGELFVRLLYLSVFTPVFLICWRAFMMRRWACSLFFAFCCWFTYSILTTWYYCQYLPEVPPDPIQGRIGTESIIFMAVTALLTPTLILRWRQLKPGV